MTIKSNKSLDNEIDDTWRRKGHSHIIDNKYIPKVCPDCNGWGKSSLGYHCDRCGGTGEVE